MAQRRNKGSVAKQAESKSAERKPQVTIYFDDHEQFERFRASAMRNRRTMSGHALMIIDNAISDEMLSREAA